MNEALFNEQINYYLPSIILTGAVLLLMLLTAYKRNHKNASRITTAGLAAALLTQLLQVGMDSYQTPLLVFDGISSLVSAFILFAGLMVSLMLYQWLQVFEDDKEEYYLLLLLSVLGALIVTSSQHFASFFIGLELMNLSLLAMIAYEGKNNKALEAGIKYLVLSSTASAFMLMAMAILFLYSGTLSIPELQGKLPELFSNHSGGVQSLAQGAAIVMLLIGITFKLSLVPAHLWAADVFEGSPLPTNALLASISKASVFVVLLRLFSDASFHNQAAVMETLALIAAASMLVGNLLGLMQRNILRLMAYSSIAHFGYILLAILALGDGPALVSVSVTTLARESALYYIIAYIVTITGVFSMLMLLPEVTTIDDLKGMLWKKPAVSSVLILLLLSLAGIPLTIGFVGKFYLAMTAVNQQLWWLLAALVTGSVMGLFYYLRMILIITDRHAAADKPAGVGSSTLQFGHLVVLLVFVSLVLGVGILPGGLADLIHTVIHI